MRWSFAHVSVLAFAMLLGASLTSQAALASGPTSGATYVAPGDSYSAGEGLGPFETGTDVGTGVEANTCHRSKSGAYADLSPAIVLPNVRGRAFWACSGATVPDIESVPGENGTPLQYGQPAQVTTVGATTNYITLTVGGDDLDFGAIGHACAEAQIHNKVWHFSKTSCSAEITASLDKVPALKAQLKQLYVRLLGESAPDSELVVAGYPKILPDSYSALGEVDGTAFCTFDHLRGVGSVGMPVPDAKLVASFELKLNAAVKTAVDATATTHPQRIRYADLYPTSVPRNCKGTTPNATVAGVELSPLGNGIGPGGFISTATFHPTKAGQRVYAQAVQSSFDASTTLPDRGLSMPVEAGVFEAPKAQPARVYLAGDGSWILAGFTSSRVTIAGGNLGHLSWTTWDSRAGRATGALWINPCEPSCGNDDYVPHHAAAFVSDPNRSGVFQHLLVTTASLRRRFVAEYRSGPSGGWIWRPEGYP